MQPEIAFKGQTQSSADTACPLCGAAFSPWLTEVRDYFVSLGESTEFSIQICKECGVGKTFPAITDSELSKFYPDNYEAYVPKRGFVSLIQSLKYRMDVRALSRLASAPASVYEIGAGRGEFLSELKRAKFVVGGQEPGQSGREYAKSNWGITLDPGFASEISFSRRYDVVVLRHVLEHVNEPLALLKNILNDGLNKAGLVWIKLPNFDSWEARAFGKFWSNWDLPRHRYHFTPRSVRALLERAGFKNVRVSAERVPVDFPRSLCFVARYGPDGHPWKRFARLADPVPWIAKLLLTQVLHLFVRNRQPSRMVVTASV